MLGLTESNRNVIRFKSEAFFKKKGGVQVKYFDDNIWRQAARATFVSNTLTRRKLPFVFHAQ